MKTCALYGFISTLAGAFLVLALYFLGFHSDPEKLKAAQTIGLIAGLGIVIVCTALGVRARREEVPAEEEFGYRHALGAGVLISLVASVLSAIFTYAYHAFINPGFSDILIQDATSKMEAKGISGAQLDKIESFNRIMFSPVAMALIALIFGFIFGVIISLIVAACVKRPPPPQAARV
jgi:predicted DNA repair protein MutK